MGFKIKLNHSALKQVNEATKKAIEATGEKLLAEKIQAQEIPFLEGTLQNVQTRIDKSALDKGQLLIIHDTPYARRLYYHPEYNFTTTFNVNAKGEWWEDVLTGDKKGRPQFLFAHYLKKYGGGVVK